MHRPGFLGKGLSWITIHRRPLFQSLLLLKLGMALGRIWVYFLFQDGRWYNFVSYWDFASTAAERYFPYIHYWVEYPPIFPWLVTLLYLVVAPANTLARPLFYILNSLVLLAADGGSLLAVYRLGRIVYRDERSAVLAAVFQTLFFIPVYLYTGWFDTLPTLFLLLSLVYILENRPGRAAIFAALGTLTKVFPIVAAVTGWLYFSHANRKRLVAGFMVVFLLVVVPLMIAGPEMTLASIRGYWTRPSWETVWALMDGYYGSGGHPPTEARFDPAFTTWIHHPAWLPGWVPTALLMLVVSVVLIRVRGPISPIQSVALTALLLNLFVLLSKGYSPQYLTWLLPCMALLAVEKSVWPFVISGLVLANLIEYPLYFHFFPQKPGVLVIAIVIRTALLLLASLFQWQRLQVGDTFR